MTRVVLILAALSAACGGGGSTSHEPVVRDSAGIRIVENSGPAWAEDTAWRLSAEPVLTIGAAEANYLAVNTFLEPGDEVVMVLPNYMQIWGVAKNRGCRIKEVHLDVDDDWSLDAAALDGIEEHGTFRFDRGLQRDEVLVDAIFHDRSADALAVQRIGGRVIDRRQPADGERPQDRCDAADLGRARAVGLRLAGLHRSG